MPGSSDPSKPPESESEPVVPSDVVTPPEPLVEPDELEVGELVGELEACGLAVDVPVRGEALGWAVVLGTPEPDGTVSQ